MSTLSMPSLEAPPPKMAVKILNPMVSKLAQGDGEPTSVSKLSLLFGPVPPGLKSMCIIIPENTSIDEITTTDPQTTNKPLRFKGIALLMITSKLLISYPCC